MTPFRACVLFVTVLLGMLAGCSSSNHVTTPEREAQQDDTELARFQALNDEDYRQFINYRCLKLGQALVDLASQDAARHDLATLALDDIRKLEEQKGRIVPREIDAELRKSDPDLNWLSIRGRLLMAAHGFESDSRESWESAAAKMKVLGLEGEEFLIAQMVKRLANAQPIVRDRATYILAEIADRELSARALADACFVELAGQEGVFPSRVALALENIGTMAVDPILARFRVDGHFDPASGNWKTRRYLVQALGKIGSPKAVDTLLSELEELNLGNDDSEFIYRQVLIQALGGCGDMRAAKPIALEWQRDESLAAVARPALFQLSGIIYEDAQHFLSQSGE